MKKILVAGAALMLASGSAATVHALQFPSTAPAMPASVQKAKPGVTLSGDARVRLWYADEGLGSLTNGVQSGQTNMDSRVRLNVTGTAAGGAYAKARIRMYESFMGGTDNDLINNTNGQASNIWVDLAYVGIPFSDAFTLELGKYRSTYGPMPILHNFFYDDVHLSGARGIWKVGGVVVNPFVEWMDEAQSSTVDNNPNKNFDNDSIRYGAHVKAMINKNWTVGGMAGYQSDQRIETANWEKNEGYFGSIYASGRAGAFGFVGELAVTDAALNNFNSWADDDDFVRDDNGILSMTEDRIGSGDTGFGGYVFPTYQMDKLNIGLNLGFTDGGFQPDRVFGFVMLGGTDNSRISAVRIGDTGDWMWAGLVTEYSISESLKLTGNLVYADVDAWASIGPNGEGPITGTRVDALDNVWELSAVLQYTISKGANVFFSAGYLSVDYDDDALVNRALAGAEDSAFGALTRFELKF